MKVSAYLRTCLVLLPGLLAGLPATAAVDGTPATVVTNLRVESNYGFIGFAQAIPSCGERVWVDMTTPLGRSVYSTAMLAFATGRSVVIRADNASTRVFGACNIYDIYVAQ
jgi:hypothetical protein